MLSWYNVVNNKYEAVSNNEREKGANKFKIQYATPKSDLPTWLTFDDAANDPLYYRAEMGGLNKMNKEMQTMLKNKSSNLIISSSLLLLICVGCESGENQVEQVKAIEPIEPNPITASPKLIEEVRSKGWLDLFTPCNHGSLFKSDYENCIRVEAALLPPLEPSKRDHFGQYYDPKKYYECRSGVKRNNMKCTKYALRRDEADPVWPYPDVPPPKYPEAPKDSGYREGMKSEEYFNHLCKTEAGTFIYKTVEDVEGVYQVRPRKLASDTMNKDRYVMEDPYGYTLGEAERPGFSFVGINYQRYHFFESPIYEPWKRMWKGKSGKGLMRQKTLTLRHYHPSFIEEPDEGTNYIRYSGNQDQSTFRTMIKEYDTQIKSRYGYTWRGIERPHDREHGIAGGETIVLDLQTNEILAIWRGFIRSGDKNSKQVWWLRGQVCPKKHGDSYEIYKFINKILKPKQFDVNEKEIRNEQ